MPIIRKPGPAQAVALVGQIPQPPNLPTEVTDRFDSMKQWQEEVDRWWARFGDMLQRDLDQIAAKFTADAALIKSLQNDVAALKSKLP
jgi:hypothetical protein